VSLPVNYLAVEPLIIARLVEQIGGDLEKIGGVAEFEATLDADGPYPSAFVLYDNEIVGQRGHDGRLMRSLQTWQVSLLARPEIDTQNGNASLVAAGTLLSRIIDALTGWRPAEGFQVLKRVQARGKSVVYANGLALFVLDFEVGLPITLGGTA
jgi:hypothetical protein